MNLKTALAGGGALLVLGAIIGTLVYAAFAPNPVKEAAKALSPAAGEVAATICNKPETEITRVLTPQRHYYEAKYEIEGLRYDLTWEEGGTAIAVEKLKGRDFDVWAEQKSSDFDFCIETKDKAGQVQVREAAH